MVPGICTRDDSARNQPMQYAHHGYTYELLNFRGEYLRTRNTRVPCAGNQREMWGNYWAEKKIQRSFEWSMNPYRADERGGEPPAVSDQRQRFVSNHIFNVVAEAFSTLNRGKHQCWAVRRLNFTLLVLISLLTRIECWPDLQGCLTHIRSLHTMVKLSSKWLISLDCMNHHCFETIEINRGF